MHKHPILFSRIKYFAPKIHRFCNHWFFVAFVRLFGFGFLIFFAIRHPVPGMAAMVGGGFVALMALRQLGSIERFYCIVVVIGFVGVELKSISQEHSAQQEERLKDQSDFQKRFDTTERHFEAVIKDVDELLKSDTGGNSIPFVCPQSEAWGFFKEVDGKKIDAFPLILWDRGRYPLSGITINVIDLDDVANGTALGMYYNPSEIVPEVAAREFVPLKGKLAPDLSDGKDHGFMIQMHAKNGNFTEVLRLRLPPKNTHGPDFVYWITKETIPDPSHPNITSSTTVLSKLNWDDEPPNKNNVKEPQ